MQQLLKFATNVHLLFGMLPLPEGSGKELSSGQAWNFDVRPGTAGARVWARTNCNFDASGRGHFETGDCGGLLSCQGY